LTSSIAPLKGPPVQDHQLPVPVWASGLRDRTELQRQLALTATRSWACAVIHFTGESASALSKRFSAPDGSPGSNSKYFYGLFQGKHVLLPGVRGRYGYDLLADVHRHNHGGYATRHYYQPWELLHPNITLDRVCAILYQLAPQIAEFFFYPPFPGLEDQPAWLRRQSVIPSEMEVLNNYQGGSVSTERDGTLIRQQRKFDVFIALWCLYREAELRRDIVRTLFYKEAIGQAQKKMASHPLFCDVFDSYVTLASALENSMMALLQAARRQQRNDEATSRGKPTHVVHFDKRGMIVQIECFDPDDSP